MNSEILKWTVKFIKETEAALKKKKRTRKDTENVRCLILWGSL